MNHRIFIAINLPEDTKKKLTEYQDKWPELPVRWTKKENIHITLKFIGEISSDQYTQIEDALNQTDFNSGGIVLNIRGCGKFGKGHSLNILWIGIEQNEKLENIYNKIEASLAKKGIPREQRIFKPHITVGRNRKAFNFKSFLEILEKESDCFISKFYISHFQIFKSQLRPEGPIYTILKEIPLAQT